MRDRTSLVILAAVVGVALWSLVALAQGATNPPPGFADPGQVSLTELRAGGGAVSFTSQREFVLSLLVMVFGLVVVLGEFVLLYRRPEVAVEDLLKVIAVTLILIGTLMALTAGFSSEQIAPAMGLFGTIAGYMLGRGQSTSGGEGDAGG